MRFARLDFEKIPRRQYCYRDCLRKLEIEERLARAEQADFEAAQLADSLTGESAPKHGPLDSATTELPFNLDSMPPQIAGKNSSGYGRQWRAHCPEDMFANACKKLWAERSRRGPSGRRGANPGGDAPRPNCGRQAQPVGARAEGRYLCEQLRLRALVGTLDAETKPAHG